MNLKKIISIILFLLILITFFIYNDPIYPDVLEYKEYNITTNFSNRHKKPPLFLDDRVNKKGLHAFFIHPGAKLDSKGIFTFNNSANLVLRFSIKEGSKIGDIEFKIKKNNNPYKKFVINSKQNKIFRLHFDKNDTLTIIANNHGNMAGDWGYLEIWHNTIYEYIFIIFLWLIYFIYLIKNNFYYLSFITLLLFLTLTYSYYLHYKQLEFILLLYASIYSMFTGYIYIISNLFFKNKFINKIAKIFTILFISLSFFISIVYIIYYFTTNESITNDILYAICETNSIEAYEYIDNNINIEYLVYSSIFIIFTTWILIKDINKRLINESTYIAVLITILLFIILSIDIENIPIVGNVYGAYSKFYKELEAFKKIKRERKFSEENLKADKNGTKETYIFIIGESLNKYHMSLYGYFRDTNPLLNKETDIIKFSNVYSNYVHTSPVLTYALTYANQYNKMKFWNTPSIINILNSANFKTYWLTNQILYSEWDNKISALATDAKKVIALNSNIGVTNRNILTTNYDGKLIPIVKKILNKKETKNRAIFIHLMGNHVKYSQRYPDSFNKFKNPLSIQIFGKDASQVTDLNEYDNSVLYNDYVVYSILKLLKQTNSNIKGFIYMPDHADDPDKLGHLAHNINKFTFDMTQIPMIMWFNKKYKIKYKNKFNMLLKHRDSLFSNDLLYDTIIGITNIHTNYYNNYFDLSSKEYNLNEDKALELHGMKKYKDPKNRFYWLGKNFKFIKDNNLSSHIFISNVNSIGKANILYNFGYKNFIQDINNIDKCYLYPKKYQLFKDKIKTKIKNFIYNFLDKKMDYNIVCKKGIFINNNIQKWQKFIQKINKEKIKVIISNFNMYKKIKYNLIPNLQSNITIILDTNISIGSNNFIKYIKHIGTTLPNNIIISTKYKSNYD